MDILFKNNQPTVAVPGGSVFNGLVSLGRAGANVTFISEVGGDHVGEIILNFMKDNGISTDNVMVYPDRKSPVSLAFLNEKNDAEYSFYKDYPSLRLDVDMPEVTSDDIVMFGSFYAITPQLRDKVKELLDKARKVGAIIYYDVNFRSTHANEAIKLMPTILENFEYADIVRGSTEDFGNMFGITDADKVYQHKVGFYLDINLFKQIGNDQPVKVKETDGKLYYYENGKGVEKGLIKFVNTYADKNITSIAFPKLGCGNGELSWDDVRPLMEKYLKPLPIDVYIYLGVIPDSPPEHKIRKAVQKYFRIFTISSCEMHEYFVIDTF